METIADYLFTDRHEIEMALDCAFPFWHTPLRLQAVSHCGELVALQKRLSENKASSVVAIHFVFNHPHFKREADGFWQTAAKEIANEQCSISLHSHLWKSAQDMLYELNNTVNSDSRLLFVDKKMPISAKKRFYQASETVSSIKKLEKNKLFPLQSRFSSYQHELVESIAAKTEMGLLLLYREIKSGMPCNALAKAAQAHIRDQLESDGLPAQAEVFLQAFPIAIAPDAHKPTMPYDGAIEHSDFAEQSPPPSNRTAKASGGFVNNHFLTSLSDTCMINIHLNASQAGLHYSRSRTVFLHDKLPPFLKKRYEVFQQAVENRIADATAKAENGQDDSFASSAFTSIEKANTYGFFLTTLLSPSQHFSTLVKTQVSLHFSVDTAMESYVQRSDQAEKDATFVGAAFAKSAGDKNTPTDDFFKPDSTFAETPWRDGEKWLTGNKTNPCHETYLNLRFIEKTNEALYNSPVMQLGACFLLRSNRKTTPQKNTVQKTRKDGTINTGKEKPKSFLGGKARQFATEKDAFDEDAFGLYMVGKPKFNCLSFF